MELFIDDIITNILSKVDRRLKVKRQIDDYTIEVCNVKWSGLFHSLIIDGDLVEIEFIDKVNGTIKFKESIVGKVKFEIPNVEFFIGSENKTNKEWTNFSHDMLKKIPFIWCNLTSNMRVDVMDSSSPFGEVYNNVQIFFIADMNKTQWLVKQTLEERTKLLKTWAKFFIDAIQSNAFGVSFNGTPQLAFMPELGRENERGVSGEIISANLSAVILTFDLNVGLEFCKC